MHYYDHYHDPNTHLQLTRQHEDELLRAAKRREIRPGLLARLRAFLRGAVPARPAQEVREGVAESAAAPANPDVMPAVTIGTFHADADRVQPSPPLSTGLRNPC